MHSSVPRIQIIVDWRKKSVMELLQLKHVRWMKTSTLQNLSSHRMTHTFADYHHPLDDSLTSARCEKLSQVKLNPENSHKLPFHIIFLSRKCFSFIFAKSHKKDFAPINERIFSHFLIFRSHKHIWSGGGKRGKRWLFFSRAGNFPTIYNWRLEGKLFTLNFLKDFLKMTSRLIFQIRSLDCMLLKSV